MSTESSNRSKTTAQKKNETVQLLTFKLDDQEYALDIYNVVQVVRMVALTRPPKAPDYMEGMFNLRGKVIPVINVRMRYGLPGKPHDLDTQLLIAKAGGKMLAITVDVVSEVLTLSTDTIEPPDQIGPDLQYLKAVAKVGDRLILILDPDTLLTNTVEAFRSAGMEKMEMA
ncbi:MAG: purine-binding chemotaxis protein CheW [Chloroflexi bacterium]|nr:purine-binding chemotaxis protein CheW [Chloroflexota bacterium]